MVLPLLMAGAGTAMGMYGAQKKKKALRGAEDRYRELIANLMRQRQLATQEAQGQLGEMSAEHNQQLGGAVGDWLKADQAGGDPAYAGNVLSTVSALKDQSGGGQNPWNAQSGASQAAVAAQDSHGAARLQTAITAGQASDRQRRLGILRQNALTPYTLGEMSRASRLQRLQQAMALRQSELNNQFQLDQAGAQNDLNAAGRAGDHQLMWGTLLQSLGGAMGGYGGGDSAQGGQAAQPNTGTSPYNLDNGGWAGYDYPQGGNYA